MYYILLTKLPINELPLINRLGVPDGMEDYLLVAIFFLCMFLFCFNPWVSAPEYKFIACGSPGFRVQKGDIVECLVEGTTYYGRVCYTTNGRVLCINRFPDNEEMIIRREQVKTLSYAGKNRNHKSFKPQALHKD